MVEQFTTVAGVQLGTISFVSCDINQAEGCHDIFLSKFIVIILHHLQFWFCWPGLTTRNVKQTIRRDPLVIISVESKRHVVLNTK